MGWPKMLLAEAAGRIAAIFATQPAFTAGRASGDAREAD
jgi:hypothetical protein